MNEKAFQDWYPDELSNCYGCGRLNDRGLRLKSFWDGDETIAIFHPKPYHVAIPGYVYGGLIASLIDCHGTGTASAASYRNEGREMGCDPPLGPPLEIRGTVEELKGRKVIVSVALSAGEEVYARGQVVAVQMPAHLIPKEQTT